MNGIVNGTAWTPVVRPTDSGHAPAHARPEYDDLFTPVNARRPRAYERHAKPDVPDLFAVAHERLRGARHAAQPPAAKHAKHASDLYTPPQNSLFAPAHARPEPTELVPLSRRERPAKRHEAPPLDAVLDTAPLPFKRRDRSDTGPIVYALDTPATGLRKFDLGSVPASVTPPRSWRKAAWFAVGTSAAVVLGLAFAAAELVGRPAQQPLIDALPAYPTGPLTLDQLPVNETSEQPSPSTRRSSNTPEQPDTAQHSDAPKNTIDLPTDQDPSPPGDPASSPGEGPGTPAPPTEPPPPTRETVGPAPVTPTNPAAMGDTTEAYYRLVTDDPAAAHGMTTGDMARAGAEGIEARYVGVERVEVQHITIDRNQATTTSTVKIVREDGTETIETRQLTFTWGADPKITDESVAG